MSELKAKHACDVYEDYTKTGDDEQAQVYLKSEADREIARQKRKRCLALAEWCDSESYVARWYHDNIDLCRWFEKWQKRWLAIAEKFKEAK